MYHIVTTRFDSTTLKENEYFKLKSNLNGCIYGQPKLMPKSITINQNVFVVEMNNSLNLIEGIGLIKNITYHDTFYKIYNSENYNQYIYKSNYRVDRYQLIKYNEKLVLSLDQRLFKGKGHLKRGYGFTTITDKLIQNIENNDFNLIKELQTLFIQKYINNENNYIK